MSVEKRKVPVSVLVLTRNEEVNIAACLESVLWADEVLVVDSYSTDGTVEICKSMGAKVLFHVFEGYAAQRNWALANLPFSNDWVLMLDADEHVPRNLAREIAGVISRGGNGRTGFYLKFRHIFFGRWLKHGGLYPTWVLRLFRRGCVRFEERPMNEHAILDGAAGYLTEPFEHRDRKPLSAWIAKHNRYAELEAEEFLRERFAGGYRSSIEPRLFGSQAERKRWIKLRVWNRLPLLARPFFLFFRNYFLKFGFLDGGAGLIYHVLWSFWYPFLIGAMIVEKQRSMRPTGLHPSHATELTGSALRAEPGRAGNPIPISIVLNSVSLKTWLQQTKQGGQHESSCYWWTGNSGEFSGG